jgi:hypothetical protein
MGVFIQLYKKLNIPKVNKNYVNFVCSIEWEKVPVPKALGINM